MKNFIIPQKQNKFNPYLLRKGALTIYTIILFITNVFSVFGEGTIGYVIASSITSERLIRLTNEERVKYGLDKLEVSSQLTAAAYAKANNIFEKQYWDHYGPDGESPWQFIQGAGYHYHFAGENLAKGFQTAEGTHQAWMASPTHRQNIVSGEYNEIGIAVLSGELLDEEITLVVQIFGNLTDEVQNVSNVSVPTPSEGALKEQGDIKSIRIEVPQRDSTLRDPRVTVSGTVRGVKGDLSGLEVAIFQSTYGLDENAKLLGKTEVAEGETWRVLKPFDWADGQHVLTAMLEGDNDIFDEIIFTVDASAPKIIEETLLVGYISDNSGQISISVSVYDQDPIVTLIVGSETYVMEKNSVGLYGTAFPEQKIHTKVSVLAVDSVGNMTMKDVTETVDEVIQSAQSVKSTSSVMGVISQMPTFIGSMQKQEVFNLGFGMFLLTLLVIEVYYYKKNGQLAYRAYSVFMVGIWIVLLLSAVFIGFTGTVV